MLGATVAVASLGLATPALADSSCSVGSGPAAVGAHDGGVQACVAFGNIGGTVTAAPGYVVADGKSTNPEPLDGYVGADTSGPVGCASGDYSSGGGNNSLLNVDPTGPCAPQLPY